ncbi:PilN domain-containing protein [Actinoplanes sp. NPDC023801]|uniref:PilN domain-containing protein n=1 Tax=Actinoplanes sp. NPDC023801 TaxID=3154595 RepID=UPI00340607AB
MTTTALMPVDPSVSPQQAARVLTIRADLMPPEIRDGRRSRRIRSLIVFVVLLVVAAVGAWYWQTTVAKATADEDYEAMFQTLTDTRADQRTDEFRTLVEYQDGGEILKTELTAVLADDLSWTNLINLIGDTARQEKVGLTELNAGLAEKAEGAKDPGGAVGTLNISGVAKDKHVIANFVNELGSLRHVTNPFVTAANKDKETNYYSFSITVTITDKALCGRFTTKCPSGGK